LAQTSTSVMPFLGSDVAAKYDTSKVVILPIAYEATTTYRRGCENGPDSILELRIRWNITTRNWIEKQDLK
jgi:agmatinase